MPSGSVRLYDPYDPANLDYYTGRWVVTIGPYTPPVGSDGQVQEFEFEVPIQGIPDAFIGFYLGGDAPTDLSGGFTFDSDSPFAWVTGFGAKSFGTGALFIYPGSWLSGDNSATEAQLYDGAWSGSFSLGFVVTVDSASDASWLPPPQYEVVVVAQDGTPFGTLADAKLSRVSWELNGPGAAEVSLATTDADAALMVPGREVQVFYQGGTDPIWWGPIVRPQAGLNESSWQCAGLLWYFSHRFMGRADRTNQLSNGDFEAGETDWSFSGVTHSIDTGEHIEEPSGQSLKLTGGSADHQTYATQTFTHGAGGYPVVGDFMTGSVWVKIPSADYLDPAHQDRGLMLVHRDNSGNVIDVQAATINDDTEKDKWIELEAGVAGVKDGDTVEVRLYPPHGVAYFDLATLTFMESLSFGYPPPGIDVTDIIEGIVGYAQTSGKSDLNIATAGSDTGVTRQVAYQFAEHRNIADAIMEYVRQGICDISIELGATTRTFTVWPSDTAVDSRGLGKGVLYGTTLELDVNLADFTWSQDLEQAASSVVLLGPGDGPDRPEGGAIDTSFAGGAFTAEIVEQAPDPTTVGQLDQRAAERLATAARPEILEVTTLPGAGVIGDLAVGDTVPVVISIGWVDIDATYRVARIEADLLKDQATITLNALP